MPSSKKALVPGDPLEADRRTPSGSRPGPGGAQLGPAPITGAAEAAAQRSARVVIARVSPSVDGGRFAVKRVAGERLQLEADIFADGHEQLAAQVLTRVSGAGPWTTHALAPQANDRWTTEFRLEHLGLHEMVVEAWVDRWGGFRRDLGKKLEAGRNLTLEVQEARRLIEAAQQGSPSHQAAALGQALGQLTEADLADQLTLLLGDALARAMADADERPFLARSFVQPVRVDRKAAQFASWYELFPRSQTSTAGRHGTFADVIDRLPRVAAMGFDTLYFPPIHPIGRKNRKGRNNNLTAGPDDVGSPYAIGAVEGGHTAIHPDLGTLEDFRALVAAAARHDVELAMDFAIQCAPDHPWLREHPEWFDWRPDGSLKYAENPPKTYEDIVNVDFYGAGAAPGLWEALRDVVLFWIDEGVRVFRVDNPHTKPLPFWQWMIADIKARRPEVIFLSEAFTRPGPMYHLAKIGFSQSYTYFIWRNSKSELQTYLRELTQTDVREFYRPHFFVNTPDINPYFLQTSGRAGFLIRAALAATLSGLFGVYAGFEFCEAAALPGREEYLDSEKYEIRPRPDRADGDIVDEIAQLNRLRRAHPALQSHLGLSFHNAFNDQILYYSKSSPDRPELILVAVSLDPHQAQEADFEIPLWLFGLEDWDSLDAEDLLTGAVFRWTGKIQHVRLTPDRPYALWRVAAPGAL